MSRLANLMSLLGLVAFLAVTMIPPDAMAKRRGGDGVRSGPAAHGRVITSPNRSRPAAQPSDRSRAGERRQDVRREARGERRDTRREVRDEREDVRREIREERRDVRREVREWHEDRWKRRLGISLTAAAFSALTCTPTVVILGGVHYYSCGVNWYRRTYVGSSATYVVVAPPPGY
jgi:hypothetical protein